MDCFSAPQFRDDTAAREYLEIILWPDGPVCPHWGVWIGHFFSDKQKPDAERYFPLWESQPFLLMPDRLAARRPDKKATYFNSQASTQVIG